jgi:hypothetical protein
MESPAGILSLCSADSARGENPQVEQTCKEKYAEILHQSQRKLEGQLDDFIQNINAVIAVVPISQSVVP